jgi:hypothetical protein
MARKAVRRVRTAVRLSQDTNELSRLVEEKAYHIWESKGRPENSALDNWLEAKRQLKIKN